MPLPIGYGRPGGHGPALHRISVQTCCKCGPRGARQVLFRPLTKLHVVTAVKNILDPAERTRIDKSGFPDSVVLVQISDAEEVAVPEPATAATASASKNKMAGAASSGNTPAAAVIMVESDDSDDGPAVTEPNAKKPKIAAESSTGPVAPAVALKATPCARMMCCFHGVGKAGWV